MIAECGVNPHQVSAETKGQTFDYTAMEKRTFEKALKDRSRPSKLKARVSELFLGTCFDCKMSVAHPPRNVTPKALSQECWDR